MVRLRTLHPVVAFLCRIGIWSASHVGAKDAFMYKSHDPVHSMFEPSDTERASREPNTRMLGLLEKLLKMQANAHHQRRSILKGMHSIIEESAEKDHLIELERKEKQARHGALNIKNGKSYYSNGPGTLMIPYEMFSDHRNKFVARLLGKMQNTSATRSTAIFRGPGRRWKRRGARRHARRSPSEFVIFEGGEQQPFYDSDMILDFRQEPNFFWLFGIREPGVKGAIDLRSAESYLFVPIHGELFQLQSGMNATGESALDWWKQKYEVHHVHFLDDMENVLIKATERRSPILADYDHGQDGLRDKKFKPRRLDIQESMLVSNTLTELRMIKDDYEIQITQYANDVSVEAHVAVMQQSAMASRYGGITSMEWAAEATFRYISAMHGCLEVTYQASCPGGSNTAFFHYGMGNWEPNSELVSPGEVRVLDISAAYFGYGSDITMAYPENGRFTDIQKKLYLAVLETQQEVEKRVRPGVSWWSLTDISKRGLLSRLKAGGLLTGEVDDMMQTRLINVLMPHGLGHPIGLDVHDVQDEGDSRIQENTMITIEPGVYFGPYKMKELRSSPALMKYVDMKVLPEWEKVGGIRVEDVVLVTKRGCKVMTRIARSPEDIEAIMSGEKVWNPWEQEFISYESAED